MSSLTQDESPPQVGRGSIGTFPAAVSASGSPGIEAQVRGGSSGASDVDNGSNPSVENYEPVSLRNPEVHLVLNDSRNSRTESTEDKKPEAKSRRRTRVFFDICGGQKTNDRLGFVSGCTLVVSTVCRRNQSTL